LSLLPESIEKMDGKTISPIVTSSGRAETQRIPAVWIDEIHGFGTANTV
jgi:hypothetical protein